MIDLVGTLKDPNDWISDLLVVENPIKSAVECGEGVSFETYSRQPEGVTRGHPDFIMSGGDLAEFNRCPHRWRMGYRDTETLSTEWGQLIDCLLLTPDEFGHRFAVRPETYENDKGEVKPWNGNANVCKEWLSHHEGEQIVKSELLTEAREAVRLLQADEQIAAVVANSRKQIMLTGFYDDAETGLRIPMRALLDLAPENEKFLADLKTCTNAAPRAWKSQVNNFGYHQQAARHLDMWNAAHEDTRNEFRHIIQENFAPFEVAKRMLSAEFISLGRYQYVKALKRYAKALKTDKWEGYDSPDNNSDIVIDGHLVVSPESWMVGA